MTHSDLVPESETDPQGLIGAFSLPQAQRAQVVRDVVIQSW